MIGWLVLSGQTYWVEGEINAASLSQQTQREKRPGGGGGKRGGRAAAYPQGETDWEDVRASNGQVDAAAAPTPTGVQIKGWKDGSTGTCYTRNS